MTNEVVLPIPLKRPVGKSQLLVFPHSHYCEKARWALDYKRIPFDAVPLLPGLHFVTLRRFPESSVPVLLQGQQAVQGSDQIIHFLDKQVPEYPLTPRDSRLRHQCLALEQEMDRRLGENIRRILYYWLLSYPDFIRYHFTYTMPAYKQQLFAVAYPLLRYKLTKMLDLSEDAVRHSLTDFRQMMDQLANRLDRGEYLVGDQFTRADLTAAALVAFLAMPKEHPFPWIPIPDSEAQQFQEGYRGHALIEWAATIYRLHRLR